MASRKVTMDVSATVIIEVDEGMSMSDAISELEIVGSDTVSVVDSTVDGFTVTDSK